MSYPYRVVVSHSVEETVTVRDEAQNDLVLTEYLPRERMTEILRDVLERRGWTKVDENRYAKEGEKGETMVFDVAGRKVKTTASASETISKKRTVEAGGEAAKKRIEDAKAQLRERVKRELEKRLRITDEEREKKHREMQEDIAAVLTETEAARKEELNEIVMETYAESLREKAKTFGEVVSVRENRSDDGTVYEMEITIRE
ncbi:MAG: hypothetical protein ACYS8W_12085 [Planctomycetota bacterium]|jgi:hypothetical protein